MRDLMISFAIACVLLLSHSDVAGQTNSSVTSCPVTAHTFILPDSQDNLHIKPAPFRGEKNHEIDRAYSRDIAQGWRTSLPFTYVLDYDSKHLGNPSYVSKLANSPPVLLHLGKDVPFNHGWGPIRSLGGENQAHGKGNDILRISPEQVQERIEGLRQMTDALHQAGVRWVIPYICAMTLNGHEAKRTGFWEFYDNWNEYRSIGLCPRPDSDPFDWLQRYPNGRVLRYYRYAGDYYPKWGTNHRYAACWSSLEWRTWLSEVVRFVAKSGYDGVFVDNGTSQRCGCTRCLTAFRQHLANAISPNLLRGKSLDKVTFPKSYSGSVLAVEMNRFWCDKLHNQHSTLKTVGSRELGREFIIFPNGDVHRPAYIQRALRDTDFVMFEKSHGNYGTNPGMALSHRAYNNNIFEYKFVQCLRARVRPIVLTRQDSSGLLKLNPNSARLGMAECAAFSGGGGIKLRPKFGIYQDALNEYRRFFETYPDLYVNMDSYASVAVIFWPEQKWYGNVSHEKFVRLLTDRLTVSHVLFDYISESKFTLPVLSTYATIIAPDLKYMSNEQIDVFAKYVRSGGKLVVIRDFATHDEMMEVRNAAGDKSGAMLHVASGNVLHLGNGTVSRCAGLDAVAALLRSNHSTFSCPKKDTAAHVKVNAFRSLDQGRPRIIVHFVNYNVQLGAKVIEPEHIDGIVLDLALPAGMRVDSATCYAPEESQGRILRTKGVNGRVQISVPPIRIYRILELMLSRG